MKCMLEHKQTYYCETLQQHYNNLNRSIAEKQASLSIVNNGASLVDTKNSYYRKKTKEIGDCCEAACQQINEIEASFDGCLDKLDEMSKFSTVFNNLNS